MKEVLKKIWNIIKKVYGVIFIIGIIVSIYGAFTDDINSPISWIIMTIVFTALAYVCFKKPKKKTSLFPSNITSSKNTSNILPSEPLNSHDNNASTTYIFDERNKFVGRSDGKQLSDEDATYLSQVYLEKTIEKDVEIKSRGLTDNIITDEPLNDNEVLFFNAFSEKLLEAKLNPGYVALERMGSGALNVTYYSILLGKIFLAEKDTSCSYRVMKIGNTRASRVFDNRRAAENYTHGKTDYYIEEHKTHISCWMQCPIGDYDVANMDNIDVNTAINTIPKWIKYIKRSMRDFI